jgi:hypothetical protein
MLPYHYEWVKIVRESGADLGFSSVPYAVFAYMDFLSEPISICSVED